MMSGRWYVAGLFGLAAVALAYVVVVAEPEQRPSGDPGFLPPDPELELLVDGAKEDLVLTEGVVVTCERRILFSDMAAEKPDQHGGRPPGAILEYHPDVRSISVFPSPSGGANSKPLDPAP